jgi:hypothetical protein
LYIRRSGRLGSAVWMKEAPELWDRDVQLCFDFIRCVVFTS